MVFRPVRLSYSVGLTTQQEAQVEFLIRQKKREVNIKKIQL